MIFFPHQQFPTLRSRTQQSKASKQKHLIHPPRQGTFSSPKCWSRTRPGSPAVGLSPSAAPAPRPWLLALIWGMDQTQMGHFGPSDPMICFPEGTFWKVYKACLLRACLETNFLPTPATEFLFTGITTTWPTEGDHVLFFFSLYLEIQN